MIDHIWTTRRAESRISNSERLPLLGNFISYSWTSEEHTQWVGELGERLMSDGIDVILDQWSLEDGHDVNAFMESMVTDPTIKRVIVVCDALYAEKANGRKGGVGTETQIISREVYESVEQTKFIPLLRERNDSGKACLPVFLATRKYIDWSDPDKEADAYDQLVRNILERPKRQKPALGQVPAYFLEDEAVALTCAQKARRLRELVTTGKGTPLAAFDDFVDEFLCDFERGATISLFAATATVCGYDVLVDQVQSWRCADYWIFSGIPHARWIQVPVDAVDPASRRQHATNTLAADGVAGFPRGIIRVTLRNLISSGGSHHWKSSPARTAEFHVPSHP